MGQASKLIRCMVTEIISNNAKLMRLGQSEIRQDIINSQGMYYMNLPARGIWGLTVPRVSLGNHIRRVLKEVRYIHWSVVQ